jgi:hypothetical protein
MRLTSPCRVPLAILGADLSFGIDHDNDFASQPGLEQADTCSITLTVGVSCRAPRHDCESPVSIAFLRTSKRIGKKKTLPRKGHLHSSDSKKEKPLACFFAHTAEMEIRGNGSNLEPFLLPNLVGKFKMNPMARPRTPTQVLEITGAFVNHPARGRERKAEELVASGRPTRPAWLKDRAAAIFDEYAEIGFWLSAADSMTLAVWASLSVEVENVASMGASRIAVWNRIGNSLGFDTASRSRLGVHPPLAPASPQPRNRTSKYFRPT